MAGKLKLGIPKGSLQDATIACSSARDGTSMPTAGHISPASTTRRSSAC